MLSGNGLLARIRAEPNPMTRAAVPQSVPSLHVEAVRIDAVVLFSLLLLPTLFLLVAMCLLLLLFILFCLFF